MNYNFAARDTSMKSSRDKTNFNDMPLEKLGAYLMDIQHPYMEKALVTFSIAVKAICETDAENQPALQGVLQNLRDLIARHFQQDIHEWFPYLKLSTEKLRKLDPGVLTGLFAKMKAEHHNIVSEFERLRQLSNGYTPTPGASPALKLCYAQLFNFEQDISRHVFLEEHILFPKLTERAKML